MPALQSLVVTDRAATPVNFTLIPDSDGGGSGVFSVAAADATGVSISKKRFSISRRKTSSRVRTTCKLYVPYMVNEIINGVTVPKVLKECFVDVTFNMDAMCTEQERADVVGMFSSAFASAKVLTNDTIVKDQDVY